MTLSASGITVKTLTEIVSELESEFLAIYGAGLDVTASSPDGQRIGIQAEQYAILWDACSYMEGFIEKNLKDN